MNRAEHLPENFDLAEFLQRIDYKGPVGVDSRTLRRLQFNFLLNVPFENLDIHRGRRISIDLDRIYDKVVRRRRGGFCYECNPVFGEALRAIGFDVDYLSARMITKNLQPGPEFGHLVLRVRLNETYLVDVGNGQSFREPLNFDGSNEIESEGIRYRIAQASGGFALEFRKRHKLWSPRFLFTDEKQPLSAFAAMCHYHQTSPESIFTQQPLITRATLTGRVILTPSKLTIIDGDRDRCWDLVSQAEFDEALRTHFDIDLDREF